MVESVAYYFPLEVELVAVGKVVELLTAAVFTLLGEDVAVGVIGAKRNCD
jgi:hypothetical protein